jgi:anti-sigma factor RsiW
MPMNGTEDSGRARALWRRSQATDAPEDEAGRLLDLAAFADGRLDEEDTERIAALLAADPQAASDVAAARAPLPVFSDAVAIERMIARACVLVTLPAPQRARVLPFVRPALRRGALRGVAEWASLAAALAMVGWLGFAMGSNASLALGQSSRTSFLTQLVDPDTGVLGDFGAELRT